MKLALDTNTYRAFMEGVPATVALVRAADHVFMPVPVIAELRFGFAKGTRGLDLAGAGTPIPINDVWIAALVLQHGLVLHTFDTDFDRIPQLPGA